jgi:hypothetical protein
MSSTMALIVESVGMRRAPIWTTRQMAMGAAFCRDSQPGDGVPRIPGALMQQPHEDVDSRRALT